IRSALGAADRHAGQSVLERLLEGEKLHYPEVDAGMEPQPTLVGAECGIEADAEATVDLHLPFVIDPGHAEDDLTLGFADALDQRLIGVVRMFGDDPAYAVEDLSDGLVKFDFASVPPQHFCKYRLKLLVQRRHRRNLDNIFIGDRVVPKTTLPARPGLTVIAACRPPIGNSEQVHPED